jgi:hypothetical protein
MLFRKDAWYPDMSQTGQRARAIFSVCISVEEEADPSTWTASGSVRTSSHFMFDRQINAEIQLSDLVICLVTTVNTINHRDPLLGDSRKFLFHLHLTGMAVP